MPRAVMVVLVAVLLSLSAKPQAREPRHVGLLVGVGLGSDSLGAGWEEPAPDFPDHHWQMSVALRARFGFAPSEKLSIFGEGSLSFPVTPVGYGLGIAGVGGGVDIRGDGPWYLSVVGKRIAAAMPEPIVEPIVEPVRDFRAWIGEIGVGHVSRKGPVDRNWALSAFGGPMTSNGWIFGLSFTGVWTLLLTI
jgi:hypothetical protein